MSFTPELPSWEHVIDLRPDELDWTGKYNHGVLCFLERDDIEYLGVSFQVDDSRSIETDFLWEIPRKAHANVKPIKERKRPPKQSSHQVWDELSGGLVDKITAIDWSCTPAQAKRAVEKISCIYLTVPGTFQPIAATPLQIGLIRQFLDLAEAVDCLLEFETTEEGNESCDRLREELNKQYDAFVEEYGIINNYASYFGESWWSDIRLAVRLLPLEHISTASGETKVTKADIFYERQSYPGHEGYKGSFDDEDVDQRITKAFAWCIGWYGGLDIEEIAEKTSLSRELVEDKLRELELVYRDPEIPFDSQKLLLTQEVNADAEKE